MHLPDREQQIILAHASFICRAVELIQRPAARQELEALLGAAVDSGWHALAGAVRRFAGGRRDLGGASALDDEDRVVATAILRGLQDPRTLPDPRHKADPALAAPGLAHMIHAAAAGNAQALALLSQMAEQMSRVGGDMARMAALIRPLVSGERDPDRLCSRLDPRGRQLVLQILDELGRLDLN